MLVDGTSMILVVLFDILAGKTLTKDAIDLVNVLGRAGVSLGTFPQHALEEAKKFLSELQKNSPPTYATGTDEARAKAAEALTKYFGVVMPLPTGKTDTGPSDA